jgi:HTH-type transcriptional regulator / antitoxin HipB
MMHLIDLSPYALYIMHMNLQQIGSILREARKAAGLSQQELAKPLGMSRATISAIENGTVNEIGVRKLIALCAALGLAINVSVPEKRPTLFELREENRGSKIRS